MKTTFYTIGLFVFSAIMLSPTFPQKYPSKKIEAEREKIKAKEEELNHIIDLVEYNLKVNKVLSDSEKIEREELNINVR